MLPLAALAVDCFAGMDVLTNTSEQTEPKGCQGAARLRSATQETSPSPVTNVMPTNSSKEPRVDTGDWHAQRCCGCTGLELNWGHGVAGWTSACTKEVHAGASWGCYVRIDCSNMFTSEYAGDKDSSPPLQAQLPSSPMLQDPGQQVTPEAEQCQTQRAMSAPPGQAAEIVQQEESACDGHPGQSRSLENTRKPALDVQSEQVPGARTTRDQEPVTEKHPLGAAPIPDPPAEHALALLHRGKEPLAGPLRAVAATATAQQPTPQCDTLPEAAMHQKAGNGITEGLSHQERVRDGLCASAVMPLGKPQDALPALPPNLISRAMAPVTQTAGPQPVLKLGSLLKPLTGGVSKAKAKPKLPALGWLPGE